MIVSRGIIIFVIIYQLVSVCLTQSYDENTYEKCSYNYCAQTSILGCATIYQHPNYRGWYQCFPITKDIGCITMSSWWRDGGGRASSIDTHGSCVRIYDEDNCQGFSFQADFRSNLNHAHLRNIGWEDNAKSISSCERPFNHKCSAENLFGSKILEQAVFDRVDQIKNAYGRHFRFVESVDLNLVLELLEAIMSVDHYESLIEAKVEEEIARNSAAQMKNKTGILENLLRTVALANSTESDRDVELRIALSACKEVFLLLKDTHSAFSSNKVLASAYLVTFSNVYYALASNLYELKDDTVIKLAHDMLKLSFLNSDYYMQVMAQRKAQFIVRKKSAGARSFNVITDTLVSKDYTLCELTDVSNCLHQDWGMHQRCVIELQDAITKKLEMFFIPTILRLRNFGGF